MVEQAAALAERLTTEVGDDAAAANTERITRAYKLLYGRPATDEEVRLGLNFLMADGDRQVRWKQYAHVLLAANELLYVD